MLGIIFSHEDQESDQEQLACNQKGEMMLQQLGGLNNEMTGTMDMERAESSFSSLLRRGFFAISPNIFTDELHKYVLHK